MSKPHLYDEYQKFYNMSKQSEVFSKYCQKVYGIDFSQDGFSDITQIEDLIAKSGINKTTKLLDIGCGNGGMCEYIHEKTGAMAYGFDYSEAAISSANGRDGAKRGDLFFDVGIIGEKQYPLEFFNVILSVDTLYFANDLTAFVKQIVERLKPHGVFATFFSSFGFDNKTPVEKLEADHTDLAAALKKLNLTYEAIDYTAKHFEHMKHKRAIALEMRDEFIENGLEQYSDMTISQSVDIGMSFDEFKSFSSRYMYIVRKP